mmetsp:Transcript_36932/g.66120  ORF Transcript_36932/g.66120 Transcript_36932/m.66120 type:complete len:208 (-) Transcript_36932:498-1121(-)
MIIYSKAFWGIPALLGRWYGSAFPRVIPFALASCAWSALLFLLKPHHHIPEIWEHPYPFQAFAYIVGFALIFRCNAAYSRYMEGRANVQIMTAKWSEVVAQLQQFDRMHLDERNIKAHETFMFRLQHLASLMHGLALQHLRRDFNLSNLRKFSPESRPPPVVRCLALPHSHSVPFLLLLYDNETQWQQHNRALESSRIHGHYRMRTI